GGAASGSPGAVRAAREGWLPVPELGTADRLRRVRERRLPAAPACEAARDPGTQHRADQTAGGRAARCRTPDAERTLRRHGATRGAGACDRVRSDADSLRRALRRPGPDRVEPGAEADPD